MKTEMELADILDRCLEQVRAGAPVTEVLRQYPDEAEQLRPMLALVVGLELLPDPGCSLERALPSLVKAAEEHKRQTTHKATAKTAWWFRFWRPQTMRRTNKEAATVRWFSFRPVPLLYRLAAVTTVMVILFWGAGTISADAVPGDFLYPLKLLTERVKFFLTINSENKVELRIVFSSERLREAIRLHQRDGTLDPKLLQQMLEEARQAVQLSLGLPKTSRELLVAQTEHLSQFQGQTLEQFKQQLPEQEQAAVAPYVEMSGRRAAWMRQMCDDWRGETNAAPPQSNAAPGQNDRRYWMDMCPE